MGQEFDRFREGDVVHFLDEREHVAGLVAAEAVPDTEDRTDVERRGLLVVERAQSLERIRTGPTQRDVLADDLVDPVALADLSDVLVPDPSSHSRPV